ncbi:MAG: hypothetical protein QXX95_05180 [Nitrososphaerales archaeon]
MLEEDSSEESSWALIRYLRLSKFYFDRKKIVGEGIKAHFLGEKFRFVSFYSVEDGLIIYAKPAKF